MTQTCLVNLYGLDPVQGGGTNRVAQELCRLLADLDRSGQLRVLFAVSWRMTAAFPQWVKDDQVEIIPCLPDANLSLLLKKLPVDMIITPFYWEFPFDPPHQPGLPAHVVLIADTIPLELPEIFSTKDIQHSTQIFTWCQHAAQVVTPSAHARQSLLNLTQLKTNQLSVIPWAGEIMAEAEPLKPAVENLKPFVLYPANGLPHKRHKLLLEIMKKVWEVRPDLKLVLTGYHEPDYITDLARQVGCSAEGIIDMGYIRDGQLVTLYRHAEAMLFTSMHEGFGLPLLEAMSQGCLVICAPLTSIPEVAGPAALYVDSEDPQAWAEALLTILPEQRTRLIKVGRQRVKEFSWERVRQQWYQVLIKAGLNLPDEPDPRGLSGENQIDLDVPLSVVNQELAVWTGEYARLRSEVEAKEAEIQKMAAVIRKNNAELKDFQEQTALMHILQRGRWLIRPLIKGAKWIKKIFSPRLGVLNQYEPCPLYFPARYNSEVVPSPAPLISIVTPSFNQGCFLEHTLQSVLDQNYPALEYIIQDGSSTDDTQALLTRYCERLTSCESIHDKGQANALNLGFGRSNGEIMAYLNSDDLLLPGALNYIAAYFNRHPHVDVVYGHRVMINEKNEEIGRWVLPPHDDQVLFWADYIPQETLFWRRSIWEKCGGRIDESFQFAMDWDLLLRFQSAGANMVRLPRFLGAFRVHGGQKTLTHMAGLGTVEMNRLRERCHGRVVSLADIRKGIKSYTARSVVYHYLYQWGILHY